MIKVVAVEANDDYSLSLKFSDGSFRRFDVKPYLDLGIFQELKNLDYFKLARVAFGTVQWPNEQDISPDTLYIDGVVVTESSQEKIAAYFQLIRITSSWRPGESQQWRKRSIKPQLTKSNQITLGHRPSTGL